MEASQPSRTTVHHTTSRKGMVAGMAVEMAVGMVELVTFAGMVALVMPVYIQEIVCTLKSVIQAMWAC